MKKIIINEKNIKYDTCLIKSRAIVFNKLGKIYVCNMNGTYILPGGTVENNETPLATLKRELKEELGIVDIKPKELIEIDYYHYKFPKYKTDLFENRLNKVYYYYVDVDVLNFDNSNLTDYEKEQNTKIEEYTIDELLEKIKIDINNKYSPFTNKELSIILEYYRKEI